MPDEILDHGIYSLSEAARLLGLRSPQRVRAWFRGWPRRAPRLARSEYEGISSRSCIISFLDLIEAMVVHRLAKEGISLQYLRKVYQALVAEFQSAHPFGRRTIFTDGHHIFIETANAEGGADMVEFVTRILRQYAIPPVLRPYLTRVEYDAVTLLAKRWNIYRGVVIDPRRSYGKPIVDCIGVPTAVLAAAYSANARHAKTVAEWYDIDTAHVRTAVRFENHLNRLVA